MLLNACDKETLPFTWLCENRLATVTNTNGAVTGTVRVPYENGDGSAFSEVTLNSTGLTGFQLKLAAGNLNNGSGNLAYQITGTTNTSGTAKFTLTMKGVNCSIDIYIPKPGV